MSIHMPKRARQAVLKTTEYPARFGHPDEFAHAAQMCIENDMLNGMALRKCPKATCAGQNRSFVSENYADNEC